MPRLSDMTDEEFKEYVERVAKAAQPLVRIIFETHVGTISEILLDEEKANFNLDVLAVACKALIEMYEERAQASRTDLRIVDLTTNEKDDDPEWN